MALKPLGDRIILQAIEAEEKSAGGIFLPDSAKEKPQQGKVLSVGPGKMHENGKITPIDIAVGDVVYYSKYGGTEVKVGADDLLVLSARDILAIVEK